MWYNGVGVRILGDLIYTRMTQTDDADIARILAVYDLPKIARYIAIGEQYFDYVTGHETVYFYKIFDENALIGTIHLELQEDTMFLSVVVFPQHQNAGYGTKILTDIQKDVFGLGYKRIEVSIDETNIASIRLFEKVGFTFVSQEDELRNYAWRKGEYN